MPKQSRILACILVVFLGAAFWIYQSPPRLGLDLRGGAQLTLQALVNPNQGVNQITPTILETAKFVVEQRINGLGVSEAVVQVSGDDQLIVQLPGVSDPAQAERVLGNTAQLEFRKQKIGSEATLAAEQQVLAEKQLRQQQLQLSGTPAEIAAIKREIETSQKAIADLFDITGLTGDLLEDAVAQPLDANQSNWQVAIVFDDQGGELFAKITGELGGTGRSLGIFLDNQLFSSPNVGAEFQGRGITGGRAVITGNFTLQQATDLALQLRAGALPVPVKIVENRTVGATLGADSIRSSIIAGLFGLLLVLVFMIAYYRLLGVVADVALVVYGVITIALFSLLGVTLTLPGIAGFILSIGIAVDANVLIFERTKEELALGKTLYKSVEAGFNRAWTSILDSNVTTLISCATLFWLGSGLVKGFAVTLAVGVVVSMFTAITCSRALILALISYPNLRQPSFYGVKAFGQKSTGTVV